jgi:hypothetical protein
VSDQRENHFPWRVTALVAVIVIATTAIAGFILARNGVDQLAPTEASIFTPAPDRLPIEKKRQVTMLIQVRDKGTDIASNVLIGAGGDTGFVAELMLPRNLLLPTVPPVQLKDTNGPRGPVNAQGPLQVLLNVRIDASIELDRLAWAGLIDSTEALADPAIGEAASAFPLVLDKVLAKLPADEEALGQLLTSLGSLAPTTVTNEDASHLLAVIGNGLRNQPVHREILPVDYVRGGAAPVAVVRQPAADDVVGVLFPKAALQPGHAGPARLVIQRAGASVGAVTTARLVLSRSGFGVLVDSPPVSRAAASLVFVPVDTPAALGLGRDAAQSLGLPPTSVSVDPDPEATVDVRVVLGDDYAPL